MRTSADELHCEICEEFEDVGELMKFDFRLELDAPAWRITFVLTEPHAGVCLTFSIAHAN